MNTAAVSGLGRIGLWCCGDHEVNRSEEMKYDGDGPVIRMFSLHNMIALFVTNDTNVPNPIADIDFRNAPGSTQA